VCSDGIEQFITLSSSINKFFGRVSDLYFFLREQIQTKSDDAQHFFELLIHVSVDKVIRNKQDDVCKSLSRCT
jgi:hypothetical protein